MTPADIRRAFLFLLVASALVGAIVASVLWMGIRQCTTTQP